MRSMTLALVREGERVRVTTTGGLTVVGRLVEVADGALDVESEEVGRSMIPLATVEGLERSAGTERRFRRNFGITVAASAVVGALVGALLYEESDEPYRGPIICIYECRPPSRMDGVSTGAFYGVVAGLPIALLAGLHEYERWTSAEIPGSSGVRVRAMLGSRSGLVVSLPLGNR